MNLLVKISGTYNVDMDTLDWDALRSVWPVILPEKKPDHSWSLPSEIARVSADEAREIARILDAAKAELIIVSPPDQMVVRMRNAGRDWDRGEHAKVADVLDGSAVQVSIPDVGLMLIDEVTWIDDACTESVQEHLNDGWRILAVCPPCAQRRPDYVLGRRKR